MPMNEPFQTTYLWCSTLAERGDKDPHKVARDRLRVSFLDLRERVTGLVSRIGSSIPGLTVHDITHLDALWETASLIAGDGYELTPTEGYVLGGAILLHDAAMTLAAFPGGLEDIKKTEEWRDSIALALSRQSENPVTIEAINNPTAEMTAEAVPTVLRALHAKQAELLPVTAWPGPKPSAPAEYLMQDSDLRAYYGGLIGKIAASHWWNVSALADLPPVCNAGPELPLSWRVDPKKIACLLRVADASHIDHRRAPRWLQTLERPVGESARHWTFQARLGKPSADNDSLVYTSGGDFPVDEADAWWLCFDLIQMIDRELRGVDELLEETSLPRFRLNHVKAAESPTRLARYIRTLGWKPVDTRLRVTNIPSLVERLGGARLYGNDPRVPLRELIQNAADAIRARRCVPGMSADHGIIRVTLREYDDGTWLEVLDNGIGMSAAVMTGTLLDFGASLWRSSAMQREHPGLMGRGLNPTGRVGIGFFSVFMLSEQVKVTSRRYDVGLFDTRTLEFRHGLSSRPVLRGPTDEERLMDGGTRVAARLSKPATDSAESPYFAGKGGKRRSVDLASWVAAICPALDVRIDVQGVSGKATCAIRPGDWESLPGDRFLHRLSLADKIFKTSPNVTLASNLRVLRDAAGRVYGRACITAGDERTAMRSNGAVTIGGFRADVLRHIDGILIGAEPETLARNSALPSVPVSVLSDWATEQAKLLTATDLDAVTLVHCAGVVLALGGAVGDLPIALLGRDGNSRGLRPDAAGRRTLEQLRGVIRAADSIRVFKGLNVEYDEDLDDMHRRHFEDGFVANPDLLFIGDELPKILSVFDRQWPQCVPGYAALPGSRTPFDAFRALIREMWGDECYEESDESNVGWVDDFYEVRREVAVFERPNPKYSIASFALHVKPRAKSS